MDCARLVHCICGYYYYKKEFTYRESDRQLDDIFEGGNMVPHENVYIRKIKKKTLEITEN